MRDLVSIIIPVYNKEAYLNACLNSVILQTYKNIEIIIINDGSTDNSEEILLEISANDKRIKYIKIENSGVSNARNMGIQIAKGEYISFLDADDIYCNNFIENMINAIGNNNVCYSGHFFINIDGSKKNSNISFNKNDILKSYILNKTNPIMNAWLLKRQFLINHNLQFDTELNWGEDTLFFSKILTIDKRVQYVERYLTGYNVSTTNALSINNLDKIEKDLLWVEKFKSFLEQSDRSQKEKNEIIAALDGFRVPALIIYRLNLNIELLNIQLLNKYKFYIKKMRFNNGLRSIKLYIFRIKLFLKVRK